MQLLVTEHNAQDGQSEKSPETLGVQTSVRRKRQHSFGSARQRDDSFYRWVTEADEDTNHTEFPTSSDSTQGPM